MAFNIGGWQANQRFQQGPNTAPQPTPAAAPQQQTPDPALGSLGWFQDSIARQSALHGDYGGWNNLLKQPIGYLSPQLAEANQAMAPMAYSQLFELLGNQGRTDRGAMNSVLSNIDRTTQNRQREFGSKTAGGLNQGSGVANAIQAAIGQGGANTRAQVQYAEEQSREDRRRSDLGLFLRMIQNPSLDIGFGERQADAAEGQGGNAWRDLSRLLGFGLQAAF